MGEGIDVWEGEAPGASVVLAFGVHGNERAPIEAGLELRRRLTGGDLRLERGRLALIHANPRASGEDRRWSEGGVDLNRCFHPDVLGRSPRLYEEQRANVIVEALEEVQAQILVDFHCTVEPGRRFLMQHPPASDAAHRETAELLKAEVHLCDPNLLFGGVSLDEWMSTRGRVGLCYETGWLGDPENTPQAVLEEMLNVLRGTGLLAGTARRFPRKRRIELEAAVVCQGEGFVWDPGLGQNLQQVPAGTRLGVFSSGAEVVLDRAATLIFPKKRPELLQPGKPLVYLAR